MKTARKWGLRELDLVYMIASRWIKHGIPNSEVFVAFPLSSIAGVV
jgi:hypothetical protein